MSDRPTVHLMTGLPCSGKSTLARQLMAEQPTLRRTNLDELRAMLGSGSGPGWTREGEALALATQDAAIRNAIDAGSDIVVDNTHLTPGGPNRIARLIYPGEVTFRVHDLTGVPVDECIRRDAARSHHQRVGETVIRRLLEKHHQARRNGWRLDEQLLNDTPTVEPFTPTPGLPDAWIFDIDGTVARHNGRGPYDYGLIHTDLPNTPVVRTLLALHREPTAILLISGRGRELLDATVASLHGFGARWTELHMRAIGDRRRDDIVKLDLFNRYIRGRYNPQGVHDDRDRCVRLWRALNLACFQVAPGAF